jgi:hypothetical protein
MNQHEELKPKKKRATKRILQELWKDAMESCDKINSEIDRQLNTDKELIVKEQKV